MLERIQKVLREHKDDEPLVITEETTFEELELDSLELIELIMEFEDEFGVTLEADDSLKSIKDLIAVIGAQEQA